MKLCPRCRKNKAIVHSIFGILPCNKCQKEDELIKKPKREVEFTTEDIKNQRREYRKDIIQPYRDGVISKEYLDAYGTAGIKATKQEIAQAKYVWKDTKGWWNRDKSKGGRKHE